MLRLYLLTLLTCLIVGVYGLSIPAVPGTTVTITCDKAPSTHLIWDHAATKGIIAESGVALLNASTKYYIIQRPLSESLVIRSVALSDDGDYRCYYKFRENEAQVTNLNVLIRPASIVATGPTGPVSEGTEQTLRCEVRGAKPLPTITWTVKDTSGNRTELQGSNTDILFSNKLGTRLSTLRATITRSSYRAVYICEATISIFYTIQSNVSLDVFLLPLEPEIYGTALSYDPGTVSNLQCIVRGARPAAQITWWLDGEVVEGVITDIQLLSNGTFVSSSTLLMEAPPWEEDAVLTCLATNQAVQDSGQAPPSKNTTLKMNYAPTVELNLTHDVVNEGSNAMLYCIVSSRPLPTTSHIRWTKEGIVLTGVRYNFGNASFPFLLIYNVKREDAGMYRCEVSNHLGYAESELITLEVRYKPYCTLTPGTKYAVPLGSTVTVKCDVRSYPNDVTFSWYYQTGSNRLSVTTDAGLTDPAHPLQAYSYYNVTVGQMEDYRSVVCNATNSIGRMSESCFIQLVSPGPPEAPRNCTVDKATNSTVSVSCVPGFNGGYKQTFILLQSEKGVPFHISSTWDSPEFELVGLQPDNIYSLRVCSISEKYPSHKNCSGVLTAATLPDSPVKHEGIPISDAMVGVYIAVPICVLLIVAILILSLCYYKTYREKLDKQSPCRVMVARSTGSLVFDRESPSKSDLEEEDRKNCSFQNNDREKQLMAIVDKIDWQNSCDYMNRYGNFEDLPHLSTIELQQESKFVIPTYESMPDLNRLKGNTTFASCGHHRFSPDQRDFVRDGLCNGGFDDYDFYKTTPPRINKNLCNKDIFSKKYGGDNVRDDNSVSDTISPPPQRRAPLNTVSAIEMTLRTERLLEGLVRSGSYNMAIAEGGDECSPKSNGTGISSGITPFDHTVDDRYLGINPVYF